MTLLFTTLPGYTTPVYHFDDLYFEVKGSRFLIISSESAGFNYLDAVLTIKNVNTKVYADFPFRSLISLINQHSPAS